MRWSQDGYKRALDFAARAHGPQAVPASGFPYVLHLAKVAMETIAACDADPTLDGELAVTCAVLHDTIEDTQVTKSELAEAFGDRVADGIDALSKRETDPPEQRMTKALARISAQPMEIRIVKLADRITNLEPPPQHWSAAKRAAYLKKAKEILASLRGASELLEARFEKKLLEYTAYCG
jgi:(p)ppGpp synthase/HD superfamily hydrolase